MGKENFLLERIFLISHIENGETKISLIYDYDSVDGIGVKRMMAYKKEGKVPTAKFLVSGEEISLPNFDLIGSLPICELSSFITPPCYSTAHNLSEMINLYNESQKVQEKSSFEMKSGIVHNGERAPRYAMDEKFVKDIFNVLGNVLEGKKDKSDASTVITSITKEDAIEIEKGFSLTIVDAFTRSKTEPKEHTIIL